MRLGVKFLGNNNRSDIPLLGVVNDLCKKQKKKKAPTKCSSKHTGLKVSSFYY